LNKNNANNETIIIKKRSKVLKKIDKTLKKKGIKRDDDIPIEIWLKSLPDNEKDIIKHNELNEIIGLYYMYRFSNQELSKKSLKTIYKKIKRWKKSL
jgi:enamine deaminase RidA (YjgF/YER057c/UK114 family)